MMNQQFQIQEPIPPPTNYNLKPERKLDDLLGYKFLNHNEVQEIRPLETFPMTCLFFAASWCPLSAKFINKLIEFYNEINLEDKVLEIILVSRDRNKDDFDSFYNLMPWLSLPYGDSRVKKLIDAHDIKGIPQLVLLNSKGEIIQSQGRRDVCLHDPETVQNKWDELLSSSKPQ